MGFTAINSSSPPRLDETKQVLSGTGTIEAAPSDRHATVASAYLRRGKQDESAPADKQLAPKKASAKGKRRATTAPNPQNAKKRRTSTIPDAMPATKTRGTSKKQKTDASAGENTRGSALQHEPASTRPSKKPKHQRTDEPGSTSAPSSISVIAPSTSMGSLNSPSQQTSCDAVKYSSGRGAMLYNNSLSSGKSRGSVELSQPLLDQARKAPQSSMQAGQPANRADDSNFDHDDNDFGALFDELAERIGSKTTPNPPTDGPGRSAAAESTNRKPSKHSAPKTKPSRNHDDDFLVDDDDDFAEAMVVAGEASKTTPNSTRTLRPTTKQQQPLTPPASDTNGTIVTRKSQQSARNVQGDPDDITMIDSDEDEDMIELDKAMEAAEKEGLQPRPRKQNMRNVSQHEDYGGALLDDAEKQLLKRLKSATSSTEPKPITRPAFPDPVLDRSPIFGATNFTVLRTCFRLGEALNVGSHAVRKSKNVLLEVYARVSSSMREGRKQRFVFKDLFHDKPPHLEGDFELWNQSRLWDLDGKAFLNAEGVGVMCRAIARMKRDGTKWRMEVLSIWKAGWEDVQAVAGIFYKDGAGGVNDED